MRRASRCAPLPWVVIGLATLTAPLVFSSTSSARGIGSPGHASLGTVTPGTGATRLPTTSRIGTSAAAASLPKAGTTGGSRFVHFALSASASSTAIVQKRVKSRNLRYASLGVLASLLLLALSPSTAMAVASTAGESGTVLSVIRQTFVKAFHSGKGGFLAGACQVVAFMWLRTAMNYQYKNGGSLGSTLRKLWAEGGIRRLYQGIFPWAILQAPLSRFGDTAANQLVLGFQRAFFPSVPLGLATGFGAFCGAAWRVVITPIDTCKTTLQTDGAKGWAKLMAKVRRGGIGVLWYGWEGNYLANVVGGYPFFFVYNELSARIPMCSGLWMGLARYAFIGAVGATVSDVTSNSIRVMKTKKQTSDDPNMGYLQAARDVIKSDGLFGFMFRGLDTRIFTNILQGAFFTVLWKGLFKS